ncbi:LysM peptidoglycan-binding domain-containing protein [Facklamia lactis]|uniref:LysM peptidoglycan-binding domain-containing protein n=1 Tax=Facklamia lactis TaxID=2749967 RepID=UPI001F2CFC86|nr:LysM peptidoglycan-binding domain-containing protein [Facklamia lactis]
MKYMSKNILLRSVIALSSMSLLTFSVQHVVNAQTTYTVQKGDNLYRIAQTYGLTEEELMTINGLTSTFIDVGDQLIVEGTPNASAPEAGGDQTENGSVYKVKPGDTLSSIANTHGITVSELKALNGLSSDYLDVGDELIVAGTGQAPVVDNGNNSGLPDGTYIVNPGDSLYTIASSYGVTVEQLLAWNGLVTDLIYPGDKISVLGSGQGPVQQPSVPAPGTGVTADGDHSHVVQPGENLYDLGRAYGMTEEQVMAYNGLSSNLIYPGDVIYFPSSSSEVVTEPSAQAPSSNEETNNVSPVTSSEGPGETPNAAGADKEDESESKVRRPQSSKKEKEKLTDPETKAVSPDQIEIQTHEVQEGEKLADIAKQYDISGTDIRKWNGLLNDEIAAGDVLYVSDPSQVVTKFNQERPLKDTYPIRYSFTRTDKMKDLEKLFNTSEKQIREWSDIAEDAEIETGQELTVSHPDKKPGIHEVTEEDSIASIAKKYKVSVEAIRKWNGLLDNLLYIGEEIAVANPWSTYHQVEPGETLEVLADKYSVSIEELRQWNNLPEESMIVNGVLIVSDPKAFEDENETAESEESKENSTSDETTAEDETNNEESTVEQSETAE